MHLNPDLTFFTRNKDESVSGVCASVWFIRRVGRPKRIWRWELGRANPQGYQICYMSRGWQIAIRRPLGPLSWPNREVGVDAIFLNVFHTLLQCHFLMLR